MLTEHFFENVDQLAAPFAAYVAEWLGAAIGRRGRAVLAVSGGRTPVTLFPVLSRAEVEWREVTVTLTDERWVDVQAEESNERLVRDHLLQGPAAAARFVGLKTDAASPGEGLDTCAANLRTLSLPLDVAYLGMGGDGHIASLFPDGAWPEADGNAVVVAGRAPSPPAERISLSLATLLAARRICLVISGEEKRRVYEDGKTPGPVDALPVRAVLQQRCTDVDVFIARN